MAQQRNQAQSSQRPGHYVTVTLAISELQDKGRKRVPGPHAGSKCIAFRDGKDCGAIIAESNDCAEPICRPCRRRLLKDAMDRGWNIANLVDVSERLRKLAGLKRESAA